MHKQLRRLRDTVKRLPWKRIGVISAVAAIGLLLAVQIFYPSDRLLPLTHIDGISLGGMTKTAASTRLNAAYATHRVSIYLSNGTQPVVSPTLSEAKINVDNTARIQAITYPWYLRLLPGSLFWAQRGSPEVPKPVYGAGFAPYVQTVLMPLCKIAPIDASLKVSSDKLEVVPSHTGSTCEESDVMKSLKAISPILERATDVRVASKQLAPKVTDAIAQAKTDELNSRLHDGMTIMFENQVLSTVPNSVVLSWLDIASGGGELSVSVDADRARAWLDSTIARNVAVSPGVSFITTLDFTETSRVDGNSGRALDEQATIDSIQHVVDGQAAQLWPW